MITAVDVGATKTLLGQFGDDGKLVNESRFETPQEAESFLNELKQALGNMKDTEAICIAVPGIVDDDGTLVRCGVLSWRNVPIKKMLSSTYNCPVYVGNDAKLAALYAVNSLPELPRIGLYITVSTGIGGGVVFDGTLCPYLDVSEPGHMVLRLDGELRVWQDFASGHALTEHFKKQVHELNSPEEWQEVAHRISIGLHALIPAFQPDVIVFGGGAGGFLPQFQEVLEKEVKSKISPYINMPTFVVAERPNEAVLYGCHYYATHQ